MRQVHNLYTQYNDHIFDQPLFGYGLYSHTANLWRCHHTVNYKTCRVIAAVNDHVQLLHVRLTPLMIYGGVTTLFITKFVVLVVPYMFILDFHLYDHQHMSQIYIDTWPFPTVSPDFGPVTGGVTCINLPILQGVTTFSPGFGWGHVGSPMHATGLEVVFFDVARAILTFESLFWLFCNLLPSELATN